MKPIEIARGVGRYGAPAGPERSPRWLYRLLQRPHLPTALSSATSIALLALLAIGTFGVRVGPFDNHGPLALGRFSNPEIENNFFNFVLWIAWLPALTLGTALVGRWWCGSFCPIRLLADASRAVGERVLGRGSSTPYLRLGWLLPVTFIAVTYLVKALHVQDTARTGAKFFFVVLASASAVSFVTARGTWCRFVCPIGGWLARVTRLSALHVTSEPRTCGGCEHKACQREGSPAGRCPAFLKPSALDTNRHCLACWRCFRNCPDSEASMRLAWRWPGAELAEGRSLDGWEAVFVAGMLGMFVAVGHRSALLARLPFAALLLGLIALAVALYLALCWGIAQVAQIPFREGVRRWGYVFLPLEVGTAFVAFGDDSLAFFGVTRLVGRGLILVCLAWSLLVLVPIVRRAASSPGRALAAATPLAFALVGFAWLWLGWY